MSYSYECSKISIGIIDDLGTRALCTVSHHIKDHATSTTGPEVPKGHRLLTSDIVRVDVSLNKIAVYTRSGSEYWMSNSEGATPIELTDQLEIAHWFKMRERKNR